MGAREGRGMGGRARRELWMHIDGLEAAQPSYERPHSCQMQQVFPHLVLKPM